MKARISLSSKLSAADKRELTESIEHLAEQSSKRALTRVQYLIFVAIHNALGVGEKRLYEQILPEYNKLLEHYSVWKDDEVQDVMLQRLVTQSFPSLDDIFKGCPREKPSWEE